MRDIYLKAVLSGYRIVGVVIPLVEYLGPHQCAHAGIGIYLLESVSVLVPLIVQIDDVICGAALVLLSCTKYLSFHLDAHFLLRFLVLHVVPSVEVALHALLPQVVVRVLLFINMHFAHTAICNSEILVKTIGL
jgi:hypothetical protein